MNSTKLIRSVEDGLLYSAVSYGMDDDNNLKNSAKYFAADLLYDYLLKDIVDARVKGFVSGAEFQSGAILLTDSLFTSLIDYGVSKLSSMPEKYEKILTRAALAQVSRGAVNAIMPINSTIPKVGISDV